MKANLFLIAVILLTGCSANWKLRKAERLIKQAGERGAKWQTDTVFVTIPVIIPETRVDSIFKVLPGDTVVLEKDRLKVIYVRLPGDSVYISGECDSLVIEKRVPVTITKVINAPKSNWWRALLIGAGIGAFLVLFVLFVLRR